MAVIKIEKKGHTDALRYLDEALDLADATDEEFSNLVRGSVWYRRLEILVGMGREDEALREADKMIASGASRNILNDSYQYYSYRFKAEEALARGEDIAAVELMKQALEHFPKEYPDMDELEAIWAGRFADPKETYVKLEALTHHGAVVGFDSRRL